MGRKFLLTGLPGSGKSTVVLRCVEKLRDRGLRVGGISTPEVKRSGRRVGFEVVDLSTGRRGILAAIGIRSRYMVGKYGVDVEGFEAVALPALRYAEEVCDIVCIDEIGRMELYSKPFEELVRRILGGVKPVIAVIHRRYARAYSVYGELIWVSREKINRLVSYIVAELEGDAGSRGG